jgi:hypothetical protein
MENELGRPDACYQIGTQWVADYSQPARSQKARTQRNAHALHACYHRRWPCDDDLA